jgi:hypothetical protein
MGIDPDFLRTIQKAILIDAGSHNTERAIYVSHFLEKKHISRKKARTIAAALLYLTNPHTRQREHNSVSQSAIAKAAKLLAPLVVEHLGPLGWLKLGC